MLGPLTKIRLLLVLAATAVALVALAPAAQAYIYWGHFAYGVGVGRAGLDASAVNENFIPSQPGEAGANSRGVAANGANVFWGNDNPQHAATIGRAAADGSSPSYAFAAASGRTITGLAVSPAYIYWTAVDNGPSEVGRTPIAGGQQVESFGSNFGDPNPFSCGVAVDDKYVYWANRDTSTIGRASLAHFGEAGNADGNWIKLGTDVLPCGVAVDGSYVYWGVYQTSDGSSVSPGTTLGRAKKADGSEATNSFISGARMVSGVALDGS